MNESQITKAEAQLVLKEKDRKVTKRCAWFATIIYILIFPFVMRLLAFALLIMPSAGVDIRGILIGLPMILTCLSIPLSIPLALYLIWSRYFRSNYLWSREFCFLPIRCFLEQ